MCQQYGCLWRSSGRLQASPNYLSNVTGRHFSADMAAIAPYIFDDATNPAHQAMDIPLDAMVDTDDDPEDSSILDDITEVAKLMAILSNGVNQAESSMKGNKHGADPAICIGTEFEMPAHRVILATHCVPLHGLLGGHGALHDESSKISATFTPVLSDASLLPVLHFTGITLLSLLILLHYLYADEVLAVWDRRMGSLFEAEFSRLSLSAARVKADLVTLVRLLHLPHLASALQFVGKRVAKSTAGDDYQRLFNQAQLGGSSRRHVPQDPLAPDVALYFAEKTSYTHSVVLRARSAFFAALFGNPDWTVDRRDNAGVVDVDLGYYKWQVMRFVLPFVCFGEETMFEALGESTNGIHDIVI